MPAAAILIALPPSFVLAWLLAQIIVNYWPYMLGAAVLFAAFILAGAWATMDPRRSLRFWHR